MVRVFNEIMGNVTRFIEGTWVTDIAELLQKIEAHEKNLRDKRHAPKLQQKLREELGSVKRRTAQV